MWTDSQNALYCYVTTGCVLAVVTKNCFAWNCHWLNTRSVTETVKPGSYFLRMLRNGARTDCCITNSLYDGVVMLWRLILRKLIYWNQYATCKPGPNLIELLSTNINFCPARNFFLDKKPDFQPSICCILLVTGIRLLFAYPENHVDI